MYPGELALSLTMAKPIVAPCHVFATSKVLESICPSLKREFSESGQ